MSARSLPEDVALLSWLAEQIGVSESTCYRLAATGQLADFGVFRVGVQYRVSKPRALHAIHGNGTDPRSP